MGKVMKTKAAANTGISVGIPVSNELLVRAAALIRNPKHFTSRFYWADTGDQYCAGDISTAGSVPCACRGKLHFQWCGRAPARYSAEAALDKALTRAAGYTDWAAERAQSGLDTDHFLCPLHKVAWAALERAAGAIYPVAEYAWPKGEPGQPGSTFTSRFRFISSSQGHEAALRIYDLAAIEQ